MAEIEKTQNGYRVRTARETLVLTGFSQGDEAGWGIWYEGVENDPDEVLMGKRCAGVTLQEMAVRAD